jgi:hypothetical protein
MTQTLSFETEVKNGYIKVPLNSIYKAKVIIVWNDDTERSEKPRPKLPYLGIDMTGYKFDREEANER